MSRYFPLFLDISNKKINVYGAGRIASRRVGTLLAFAPLLTVFAPEASEGILEAAEEGRLIYKKESYRRGSIGADVFLVLAATDEDSVNEEICRECRSKGILVNVCSDRTLCDFQFPGIAAKGDLVVGINAGGMDHHMAKTWTDRIRKEVEEDGYDNQTETASDDGKSEKDGAGDQNG
ncbi:MAG: bifunctional precorrin-2 dehydrogenase/sirohydrochlorin ferrochelatase [Clostridiales bacterium]|nr:bifunctional precorrin-2 dehydrogenase/sirohydrochlorin ferrochelatase [Clostridiales bacterium]